MQPVEDNELILSCYSNTIKGLVLKRAHLEMEQLLLDAKLI
jgi:hypothetical protein